MGPSFMRGVWWVVLICIVVYALMAFFGGQIMATESRANAPLVIRDVIDIGAHHLTGMIDVEYSCENVSVEVERVSSAYLLDLRTWRDSAACVRGPMPRDFSVRVDAPSDAVFIATLDGRPIDIALNRQNREYIRAVTPE